MYSSMFNDYNVFDTATGKFTALVSGIYYVSAQVRFDNIQGGYVQLLGQSRAECWEYK